MESDNPIVLAEEQVVPDNVHSSGQLIDMIFRKDRVEDRKQWLTKVPTGLFLDYKEAAESSGIKFSEFFNKEYILFSEYDLHRSIPHLIDGLKPSQRKVLFGCFKRKLTKNEIKVAQLVGYIAEHSAYHHGEASLQSTIVNMAQNFVVRIESFISVSYLANTHLIQSFCQGSNNINLLTPSGQFGTRRMGGKDAASARYIFTKLEPIARTIFHPDDDDLLNYLSDDGTSIEPEFYVPVIPMVLCNGSEGIGTGWSCSVCNYNPRELVECLRRKIRSEENAAALRPFYCGFSGEVSCLLRCVGGYLSHNGSFQIKFEQSHKYTVRGIIERVDDVTLHISELPLKKWTQNYKEFLEGMLLGDTKGDGKAVPELKDFKENHTETTVSFTLTAEKAKIDSWEKDSKGLYGKFKLTSSLSTSNMTLFNAEGEITKYASPEAVIGAFYEVRIDFYVKRKANLMEKLEAEKLMLSNKARFVEEVCSGDLIVSNRKRKDILAELRERNYDLIRPKEKQKDDNGETEEEDDEEEDVAVLSKGYDYLLGMKIWSLTFEKAEELRRQLADKTQELDVLAATEPSQLWLDDLDAIEEALDVRDQLLEEDKVKERRAQQTNKKRSKKIAAKKAAAGRKKKSKKKDEWDSEMEEDSDDDKVVALSDSDDDMMFKATVTKAKAKPKPPVLKGPPRKPIESPLSSDVEMKEAFKAPAAKNRAKAKPPAVKPSARKPIESPPISDIEMDEAFESREAAASRNTKIPPASELEKLEESDSDEDFSMSLSDRLKRSARNKKRPSPKASQSDSDIEIFDEPERSTTAPAAKRRFTSKAVGKSTTKTKVAMKQSKKASILDDDEDSEEPISKAVGKSKPKIEVAMKQSKKASLLDDDEDSEEKPITKRKTAPKKSKKIQTLEDDDELSFLDSESESDESAVAEQLLKQTKTVSARPGRQARKGATKSYVFDVDSEEEDDFADDVSLSD